MLTKIKENLLEMFFPSHCVLCEKVGTMLCDECMEKLLFVAVQTCPICNKISKKGKVCSSCKNKSSLSGVVSCLYFKDERVKDILHPYKYEGLFSLSGVLTKMLELKIKEEAINFDVVTYVPSSKKQERKRGYNQSKILAEEISKDFGKSIFNGLCKRPIKTQVGLPREDRQKNIKGAIYLKSGNLNGKKVLIIDDLITTGATLDECGRVLRSAGAKEVWAATVAKE